MKKIITLILILCFALNGIACGSEEGISNEESSAIAAKSESESSADESTEISTEQSSEEVSEMEEKFIEAESEVFEVTSYNQKSFSGGVNLYIAGDTPLTLDAKTYQFGNAYLLSFDKNGRLYEAGSGVLPSQNDYYGAQTRVIVPAGGFLVAFDNKSPGKLITYCQTAMGDIMIYNATVSMIYPMKAELDTENNTLKIIMGKTYEITESTIKFLFVGNSTTYFNGNPIKFEGLCRAAGLDVKVYYSTFGSAYLSEFADSNHERGQAYRNKLKQQKYTYVVFQDADGADYKSSSDSLKVLIPLAEENGATPLLYMRYSSTIKGASKHYENYSMLSEEFGIKTCKTAVAFAYTMQDHPEINLLADDNSHHSKEGAYLVACTWLMAYFNIDPRGNTYTAGLDADVAYVLQCEAYRAMTEEYTPEGNVAEKVIDGKNYSAISVGCSYTHSGAIYTGNWTDTAADGSSLGKFTDGKFSADGGDTQNGCYSGEKQNIIIDLGGTKTVKYIETDLYGNTSWGIPDPFNTTVEVFVSVDGENFTSVGKLKADSKTEENDWHKCMLSLNLSETVNARYVKLEYTMSGRFLWVSEIAVYGN